MKKILLALGGEESAHRALETAASLARAFSADLAVVSVVPGAHADDAAISEHSRRLRVARGRLAELGVDAEILEPAGDPATRIEQIAEEGGYDTIVLGASQAASTPLGRDTSVASHVVDHASGVVVVTH